jgi:HAD superfamily hydrolase (TIGR01458 family)
LMDLSGTVHIGDTPTPSAIEALEKLRRSKLKVKFVTNTTKESVRSLLARLKRIGFDVSSGDIYSSLSAAKQLIHKQHLRPHLMLHPDAMPDFDDVNTTNPNAVLVGLAPVSFNYNSMNEAFRLLMARPEVSLIAIHKGRFYSRGEEGLSLGPGPFVEALEYASTKKATVVGKPSSSFFLGALEGIGCSPEETVMIGDDWKDDIEGAMAVGMKGILVKTGKYQPKDELKTLEPPTAVCDNLSQAVSLLMTSSQHV